LVPGVLTGRLIALFRHSAYGVTALDGKDGNQIWQFHDDYRDNEPGAARLAPNGPIEVFYGSSVLDAANGTLRRTLPYPGRLFAFVDVDKDDVMDIISWYRDRLGFQVLSGLNLSMFWSRDVQARGWSLAIGDTNRDSLADLVVASWRKLEVLGAGTPVPPPELNVALRVSPQVFVVPAEIAWEVLVDGGAPPYQYKVEFGDGSPASMSPSGVHRYSRPGKYVIMANVSDLAGQFDENSADVEVLPYELSLEVSPSKGPAPLQVQVDLTVTNGGHSPFTYNVYFGDGTWATAQSIPHTYTRPGEYTVMGKVTDASGNTVWANQTVIVDALPGTPSSAAGLAVATVAVVGTAAGSALALWTTRRGRKPKLKPAHVASIKGQLET
jgi:hypothetical protein